MTVFYELAGDGARGRLERFGEGLEATGWAVELLESAAQPGLFLLHCRGADGAPLPKDVPAGAKSWPFRRVA